MDKKILDQVNVDIAWELVEEYSKFPRWKPEDVNNSCKLITDKELLPILPVEPSIEMIFILNN